MNMRRYLLAAFMALLAVAAGAPALWAETATANWGNIPLAFEANRGQSAEAVRFLARGAGYGVFFTDAETVFALAGTAHTAVTMTVDGRNRASRPEGLDAQPGASHYLMGSDGGRAAAAPHFSKVRYSNILAGIDLVYYGFQRQIEYDFIVAADARPSDIRIDFSGAEAMTLTANGDLKLTASGGEILHRHPSAYQLKNGQRRPVAVQFRRLGAWRVGFELGPYDHSLPLVIDPKVVYSTYWGGSNSTSPGELGYGIAVDAAGAVYVTGITTAPNFPLSPAPLRGAIGGDTDAFVLKINPAGTAVLASTYLGGSGNDEGHDIKVDAAGNIYITGYTSSTDFPIVNGFQRTLGGAHDAYLVKLNPDANVILYSTFIGGSEEDRGYGLAVSPEGDAYVTGSTGSRNLPVLNPMQDHNAGGLSDAFVTKIARNGALAYSTYLGGSGVDQAYDLTIDPDGNAYIAGYTTSVNFPRKNDNGGLTFFLGGPDDAFAVKIGPAGALVFALVLGGTGTDEATGIAIDADRNLYLTGYTASTNFPTWKPLQASLAGSADIFIAKIHSDGNVIDFSTYWGSDDLDGGVGIAVDNAGYVHVTGFTGSTSFPLINAVQGRLNLGTPVLVRDAFLLKLSSDGSSMVYSTYLGGRSNDGALAIAVDPAGSVYLTGYTNSEEFPAINPLQPEIADLQDAFVLKFDASDIVASIDADVPGLGLARLSLGGLQRSALFGYADVATVTGAPRPVGLALINVNQLGVTVSELGLPVTPPLQHGRLFVEEMSSSLQQSIAVVNTAGTNVTFDYYFTYTVASTSGAGDISQISNVGTLTLLPNAQIFAQLTDAPFFLNSGLQGTFSFDSSEPVAVTAVRGQINSQLNLILSRVPVYDREHVENGSTIVDYFAEGGEEWHTQIVLVNNSDNVLTGELRFFGPGNADTTASLEVTTNIAMGSVIPYTIQPGTVVRLVTQGSPDTLMTGYIEIAPTGGSPAPGAFVFIEQSDTTAATLEAQTPRDRFRVYVEAEGTWGQPLGRRTLLNMTNSSDAPLIAQLELTDMDGIATGLSGQITMPARSELSHILNELPGFETAPRPFRGLLRGTVISGTGLTVTALSALLNEKSVFVLTSTGPLREDVTDAAATVFSYIPTGAQYTTNLMLFGTADGAGTAGTVRTWDSSAHPLLLETTNGKIADGPQPWAPVITRVAPTYGIADTSVTVTLTGTNFVAGASTINPIDGIGISAVTVINTSTMTAVFGVTALASAGTRGVTVTTNGGSSAAATFLVAAGPFADLTPERTHLADFVAGFNASDSIKVRNIGTAATAGGYTVTTVMTTGLTYVSAVGDGWLCTASEQTAAQTISCSNSTTIPVDQTSPELTLTMVAGLAAAPSVQQTVTVKTDEDLSTDNDTVEEVTAVTVPTIPIFVFNPTTLGAAQQATVGLTLPAAFPFDITGSITITFTSSAAIPLDDPAIQFATGQRTVTFIIPANTLEARFGSNLAAGPIGFQTGTVAGALSFNGTLATGSLQTTFSQSNGAVDLTVPALPPTIQNLQVTNGPDGLPLEILLTVSSTTRELTTLTINFKTNPTVRVSCGRTPNCAASGTVITLNVKPLFDAWYSGDVTFGGLSTLRLPVSFPAGIKGSIFIALQNTKGFSNTVFFTLP